MREVILNSLIEAKYALENLINNSSTINSIEQASISIANVIKNGNKIITCGNGGSLCDAMHLAEELTGRYRENRSPFAAVSISDPSYITCVSNDYGYEEVFSRYVHAVGLPGDILVCFTTSGTSKNILLAAREAKKRGMKVIALTGNNQSELSQIADIHIVTPSGKYADRVQELHIKCVHIIIELIELIIRKENHEARSVK